MRSSFIRLVTGILLILTLATPPTHASATPPPMPPTAAPVLPDRGVIGKKPNRATPPTTTRRQP